jgi:hypothetical protein
MWEPYILYFTFKRRIGVSKRFGRQLAEYFGGFFHQIKVHQLLVRRDSNKPSSEEFGNLVAEKKLGTSSKHARKI